MGTVNIIDEQVEAYKQSQSNTIQRRKQWNESVKDLIDYTLDAVAKGYEIDWNVQKNEFIENLQSVHLVFGNTPSGIVKEKGKKVVKVGGSLNYSQTINGRILVVVRYPFLEEDFTSKMTPKELGVYEPQDISKHLIYEHMADFLSDMARWENS